MPTGEEAAARSFYGTVLGFTEIEKPETLRSLGGAWFSTGNLDIHLGVDPYFRPQKKAHVAYQVDDLELVANRLADAGHPVLRDDRLPGYARFYTEDPFGNCVEILTPVG